MAGIMANSATETMVSGDTSPDNAVSNYLSRETITLSVTGGGSTFSWSLAKPTSSGVSCTLRDAATGTPSFTPDVQGYYVATCVVDGVTAYVLRIGVADVSPVSTLTAQRFLPVANATIPAPAAGATLFYSLEVGGMAFKLPNGAVTAL